MDRIGRIGVLLLVISPAARGADDPTVGPSPALHPGPPKPIPADRLNQAVDRGVAYLLRSQRADGSWGSPALLGGVEITAGIGSHHAFSVAVTSLCVSALLETGGGAEVDRAIALGETYLYSELPKVRRHDPMLIYNVWAHAYGIQVLTDLHRRHAGNDARRQRIEDLIRDQYDKLTKYESAQGGWGYYDFDYGLQRPASSSTSFVNAAVLVAMHEAKKIGVPPPEKILRRGIAMTQFQRQPDGTFQYGTYLRNKPTHAVHRPGGSLGRSQACHLALRLWGDEQSTDAVAKEWLDRLITRNGWLSMGRKKPVPHESFFAVAGYFYYFGHYYAALAINQLPAADRPFYQDHLAAIILDLQEADGSWWDYPMYDYHKPYGTAYSLIILKHCRH